MSQDPSFLGSSFHMNFREARDRSDFEISLTTKVIFSLSRFEKKFEDAFLRDMVTKRDNC